MRPVRYLLIGIVGLSIILIIDILDLKMLCNSLLKLHDWSLLFLDLFPIYTLEEWMRAHMRCPFFYCFLHGIADEYFGHFCEVFPDLESCIFKIVDDRR